MGIRIVAGRDLTWAELEETRFVTLMSAGLARELFGSPEAALGRRIRGTQGGAMREIVGVVEDVRSHGLDSEPPPTIHWPSMMADFFPFQAPLFVQRGWLLPFAASWQARRGWRRRSSVPCGR